jgi:hypothetical protein
MQALGPWIHCVLDTAAEVRAYRRLTTMLSGLRSPCTIPQRCRWHTPSATCLRIEITVDEASNFACNAMDRRGELVQGGGGVGKRMDCGRSADTIRSAGSNWRPGTWRKRPRARSGSGSDPPAGYMAMLRSKRSWPSQCSRATKARRLGVPEREPAWEPPKMTDRFGWSWRDARGRPTRSDGRRSRTHGAEDTAARCRGKV